ncbi:MAG: cache domain-containing protein [Pseudomonadota bacterium]
MDFNRKLILLFVLPVILGMTAIVVWVGIQTTELSERQAHAFKHAIIEHRKEHLKEYVKIVKSALSHLEATQQGLSVLSIVELLTSIEFSKDGYFYVYDNQGNGIVHPRQPFRVGKNWIDLEDETGIPVIRNLIDNANNGGGYTEYLWEKPSLGTVAKKIGYSEMIDSRDWMIGTGAYFDDIDSQVSSMQQSMAPRITKTFFTGALIATLAVVSVFIGGLVLQINEKRLADGKLRELTGRIVQAQDEERRRFSRELHDSISQSLIGVRYLLEDIQADTRASPTDRPIDKSIRHLDHTLSEVRRISHDLHPSLLDDIGLMAAVEALIDGFRQRTGITVSFEGVRVRHLLPPDARTALYRVVQEALTNIERHSKADLASVHFGLRKNWFGVTIHDNGVGFDTNETAGQRGIGLRNISERLSYLKGVCIINSSSMTGTEIFAGVPKTLMRYRISNWDQNG